MCSMRIAIQLDDQFRVVRSEIGDVSPDPLLPPKLDPVKTSCPQFEPQSRLRLGHDLAHVAGPAGQFGVAQGPSPNPLP